MRVFLQQSLLVVASCLGLALAGCGEATPSDSTLQRALEAFYANGCEAVAIEDLTRLNGFPQTDGSYLAQVQFTITYTPPAAVLDMIAEHAAQATPIEAWLQDYQVRQQQTRPKIDAAVAACHAAYRESQVVLREKKAAIDDAKAEELAFPPSQRSSPAYRAAAARLGAAHQEAERYEDAMGPTLARCTAEANNLLPASEAQKAAAHAAALRDLTWSYEDKAFDHLLQSCQGSYQIENLVWVWRMERSMSAPKRPLVSLQEPRQEYVQGTLRFVESDQGWVMVEEPQLAATGGARSY